MGVDMKVKAIYDSVVTENHNSLYTYKIHKKNGKIIHSIFII